MSRDLHRTNEANYKLPALAPANIVHSGCLSKLSGKGLLNSATWKRRYCVLDAKRLYYYDIKERKSGEGVGKTGNYVTLSQFDTCSEVKQPTELRKGSNVLVVTSSAKTVFDTGRLYLSAESPDDLKEWLDALSRVLDDEQQQQQQRRSGSNRKPVVKPRTRIPHEEMKKKSTSTALNLETSFPAPEVLPCVTRQRTKGPSGRRLPTHPTTSHSTDAEKENDASATAAAAHQSGKTTLKTLYTYSSSDEDSLCGDASFYGGAGDAGDVTDSFYDDDADDTVETLCEAAAPPKRHSSTPMLAALAALPQSNYNSTPWRRSCKTPQEQHQHRMNADLELLGAHAGQLKSTLATLQLDVRASRRDMGSLQENLATVQSAAAGVADKVVKMQSQVIAIERQVANAVKVKRRRRRRRRRHA